MAALEYLAAFLALVALGVALCGMALSRKRDARLIMLQALMPGDQEPAPAARETDQAAPERRAQPK